MPFVVILYAFALLGAVMFALILLFFLRWMNPDYSVGVKLLYNGVALVDYYNRSPIREKRTKDDFRLSVSVWEFDLYVAVDFVPVEYDEDEQTVVDAEYNPA